MASSGQKPEILPIVLQCIGQLLTTKNYGTPYINRAKVEKLCPGTTDTIDRLIGMSVFAEN